MIYFFFSSRRRHTRYWRDWSSDVCSSDLRVKMALESQNPSYNISLVGLSWHSDTEWLAAQFIAAWNGPLLANFISKLMDDCRLKEPGEEDMKIRLIGHSLGARVILSTLDSLNKNPTWNNNNSKIASVHLMGAAVD